MPANSPQQQTRHTETLRNRWTVRAEIAKNITAVSLGEWFCLECMHPWTLTVAGDIIGVMRLLVCNNPFGERPDDSDILQPQVGVDFLSAFSFYSDAPYSWVKLWVPVVTSGAITSARLFGSERPGT
jgi:hypothetical protein